MTSEFLLILQDEGLRLFRNSLQVQGPVFEINTESLKEIEDILRNSPREGFSLLVDRRKQDVQEAQIPPLFIWDKILFLFHKRADLIGKGGFGGFGFYREEEGTFFRTIHIPAEDFLSSLLVWAASLPNPFRGVFITSLEVERFFKAQGMESQKYSLFLYPSAYSKARYLILKGSRLLAMHDFKEMSDLKASLHFLSRQYPDIHDKIQGISLLNEEINTTLPIQKYPDPTQFYRFILRQRRPLMHLRALGNESRVLKRYGEKLILCLAGALILYWSVLGIMAWKEVQQQQLPIEVLKEKTSSLKLSLKGKNIDNLRLLWDRYHTLIQRRRTPFAVINQLKELLREQQLHLMDLKWSQGKDEVMVISCFMEDAPYDALSLAVENFVLAAKHHFPKTKVEILEAPFQSSPSEMFTSRQENVLPLLRLKMRF